VFVLLTMLTYIAEGIVCLYRSLVEEGWRTPQHNGVRIMGSIIAWGLLFSFHFVAPSWRYYCGSWVLGCLFEAILLGLMLPSFLPDGFYLILLALQISRVLWNILLVSVAYVANPSPISQFDSERQPLLANEDNNRGIDEIDPDDNAFQTREQQHPKTSHWIKYVKSFGIFLPHLWPKGVKSLVCLAVVIFDVIFNRFFSVLLPRQIGIIVDKMAARNFTRIWVDILVWGFLHWVRSPWGLPLCGIMAIDVVQRNSRRSLHNLAFSHVMNLSMDFHSNKKSGEIQKSIEQAASVCFVAKQLLVSALPMAVDLGVALWYVDSLFDVYALYILIGFGSFYLWLSFLSTNTASSLHRDCCGKERVKANACGDALRNWQEISYFNRIQYEIQRYATFVANTINFEQTAEDSKLFRQSIKNLVLICGRLSLAFLAVWKIYLGEASIGSFATFEVYWGIVTLPLSSVASTHFMISSAFVEAERLLQVLHIKPSVSDHPNASKLKVSVGKVEFQNVSFAYPNRGELLRGVSFQATSGQLVAIVGKTGAGKSTMINLLFRFWDVKGGCIKIDGQDVRYVTLESLRDVLGIVPQDPMLSNESVKENVRYAKLDATDEDIYSACKAAALHDWIQSLPDGYNTTIGERGGELSGGELQRLEIARVILKGAKIISLDEATNSLDSSTEEEIQRSFKALRPGRTMFVIAHRLSTIVDADVILYLEDGEIVERGTHEELVNAKGKYFELWKKQSVQVKPTQQSDAGSGQLHGCCI